MRRKSVGLLLLVGGLGGWFGGRALGEDAKPGGKMSPEDMKKMEEMMTALGTPGEQHKWLASQEGTWDVVTKFYEPSGEVVEGKATATIRMILGGRWQEQVFLGSYRDKPFEGHGLTGYDNGKKEFVNYWFDTMSTSASMSTGQQTDDKTTLNLSGTWEMPGMKMPFRYVLTRKGDKEMHFLGFGSNEGKEFPMMDMTYTRR